MRLLIQSFSDIPGINSELEMSAGRCVHRNHRHPPPSPGAHTQGHISPRAGISVFLTPYFRRLSSHTRFSWYPPFPRSTSFLLYHIVDRARRAGVHELIFPSIAAQHASFPISYDMAYTVPSSLNLPPGTRSARTPLCLPFWSCSSFRTRRSEIPSRSSNRHPRILHHDHLMLVESTKI